MPIPSYSVTYSFTFQHTYLYIFSDFVVSYFLLDLLFVLWIRCNVYCFDVFKSIYHILVAPLSFSNLLFLSTGLLPLLHFFVILVGGWKFSSLFHLPSLSSFLHCNLAQLSCSGASHRPLSFKDTLLSADFDCLLNVFTGTCHIMVTILHRRACCSRCVPV
jgi:hypothetical protein